MAEKKQDQVQIEEQLSKMESFIEENKQKVTIVVGAVLLVIGGYFGYKNFYLPPKEKEAQTQMFQAQLYFERDSFRLALMGDGNNLGFQDIIKDYGMTKAANLAHYYAGICNLQMGNYDEAIRHLNKFSTKDLVIQAMALGAIGDAMSEKGDLKGAIGYYRKAADYKNNELISPSFLFKAGLLAEKTGDKSAAKKYFEQIKTDYPLSAQAAEIEKYIARVE